MIQQSRSIKHHKSHSNSFDDVASTYSSTSKSHVKQTMDELETTIRAMKKRHENVVKKLKEELDNAHQRLKKSERKVNDLSKLLEENSVVISTLHKKLIKKRAHTSSGVSTVPSLPSVPSAPTPSEE